MMKAASRDSSEQFELKKKNFILRIANILEISLKIMMKFNVKYHFPKSSTRVIKRKNTKINLRKKGRSRVYLARYLL